MNNQPNTITSKMKVLFVGKRLPEKRHALASLLNHQLDEEDRTTVYMYNKDSAIWDISSLRDTFGETYCIGADLCIIFGSNPYVEKKIKRISPEVKIYTYCGTQNLKKIIESECRDANRSKPIRHQLVGGPSFNTRD